MGREMGLDNIGVGEERKYIDYGKGWTEKEMTWVGYLWVGSIQSWEIIWKMEISLNLTCLETKIMPVFDKHLNPL